MKQFLSFASMALVMIVLSACGHQQIETPPTEANTHPQTTIEKPSAIIVHRYNGDIQNEWYMPLAQNLEKKYQTIALQFPGGETPMYGEWAKTLDEYQKKINQDSIVITHSVGGVFATRYLAENNLTVDKIVMVAPPYQNPGISQIDNFFDNLSWESLSNITSNLFVVHSTDDPYLTPESFENLIQVTNAKQITKNDSFGHFVEIADPSFLLEEETLGL